MSTRTSDPHPTLHFVSDLPETGSCPLGSFRILRTEEHLRWLKERLAESDLPLTLDLETWSTPDIQIGTEGHYLYAEVVLTALCSGEQLRAVIVHTDSDIPIREWFNTILDSGRPLVMHNSDYDLRFIRRETGRIPDTVIDTMVLFGLLLAGRSHAKGRHGQDEDTYGLSLSDAFGRYTGLPLPKATRSSFYGSPCGLVLTEEEIAYAAMDAIATEFVLQKMLQEIEENGMWTVAALETMLVPIVFRINTHGIHINRELLRQYEQQILDMANQHRQRLFDLMAQDCFTVVGPVREGEMELGENQLTSEEQQGLKELRTVLSNVNRQLLKPREGMKMKRLIELYREDPNQQVVVYKNILAANLGKDTSTISTTPERVLKMDSSSFWGTYIPTLTAYAVRDSSAEQLSIFLNSCKLGYLQSHSFFRQTRLAAEVVEELLQYRKVTKILSGFINPWLERTRERSVIYTRFQQTRTDTGRFSSSNPNMQNVPRPDKDIGINMRDVVQAPEGYLLVTADYSQYELRVAAQLANERAMIDLYKREGEIRERMAQILWKRYGLLPFEHEQIDSLDDPDIKELKSQLSELDLHRYNASLIFHKPQSEVTKEERTQAKVVSFGVLYGMQAESLSQRLLSDLGTPVDVEEARALLDRYFGSFPALREYIARTKELALTQGYVTTPLGRRRWAILPDQRVMRHAPVEMRDYHLELERISREMVNATIQSVNADATKIALVLLHNRLASDPEIDLENEYILLTVHDEIVVQAREHNAKRVAQYVMESMVEGSRMAGLTEVPTVVEVSVSKNWSK